MSPEVNRLARGNSRPPSQREKQRLATRERVYQAAMAEFHRVGFARAQLDRIARAAGVVRGTFYHHFPSKEDVLRETTRRVSDSIADRIAALDSRDTPLREVLSVVEEGILDTEATMGKTELLRDVLAVQLRAPVADPAEFVEPMRLVVELEAQFDEAARRGELRTDLAGGQLAGMLLSSIFGLMSGRPGTLEERRTDLSALMEVLLKGMSP